MHFKATIITIQRFTLTKHERLKSKKLIVQLFKTGKSFTVHPFRVLYLLSHNGYKPLQTGFAVSKKKFKKAVDRNRIKRLTKEAYRRQKNSLAQKLHQQKTCMAVFLIYTGNDLAEYTVVLDKINIVLQKLEKIADEIAYSNI